MEPFRSLLFVPGHKASWVEKAIRAGADAVIIDLEDSVPTHLKEEARNAAAEAIDQFAGRIGIVVRPNAFDTDDLGRDLRAVVRPGLEAILVPKPNSAADVLRIDGVVTQWEIESGVPRGSVEMILSLETAASLAQLPVLATSTPRVAALQAATARDGDISRDLGYQWTAEGLETLAYRSQVIITSRANGLDHPLCGVWQDLADLEGLRRFAESNRQLGFRGQLVIHPSHVEVVNDVYRVRSEEVERARRMIAVFEEAELRGDAAVRFEGEHIDIAHIKTARALVALSARQEGMTS